MRDYLPPVLFIVGAFFVAWEGVDYLKRSYEVVAHCRRTCRPLEGKIEENHCQCLIKVDAKNF